MDLSPIKKLFLPEELERLKSKYNGEIVVEKRGKNLRVLVNGFTESGQYLDKIWGKGLHFLRTRKFEPSNCLILGLGSGTIAKVISDYYPQTGMTGVEIDPQMVVVGKKYLGLGTVENLAIVTADADKFVQDSHEKFDLILVDLFIGGVMPQFISSPVFLKRLFNLVTPLGFVIFNLLFYNDQTRQSGNQLVELLKEKKVTLLRELTNLLVVVQDFS